MNAKRILVPTDFSPSSKTALTLAVALASSSKQAAIVLLHVVEASVPTYDEELGVLEPGALRTQMQMLAASRDHDVTMDAQVVHGDPKTRIVEFANANNIDLIVMGTHGRNGLVQLIVGSTAESVMRTANCPVMTVRDESMIQTDDPATRPHESDEARAECMLKSDGG